jgi:hypothetical protein
VAEVGGLITGKLSATLGGNKYEEIIKSFHSWHFDPSLLLEAK